MQGQQPVLLIAKDTTEQGGRSALKNNVEAAKAVADAVRTTLGPKGMDKMLVDKVGNLIITNDGVSILKEIDVDHPAAKMMVNVAKTQDVECGDGTTTAVILAGELLKQAHELVEKNVHPTVINRGYSLAADKAVEVLRELSMDASKDDEKDLIKIAMTAMTGKSAETTKEKLANFAVEAIQKADHIDRVKTVKRTGASVDASEIIDGVILDTSRAHQNMPEKIDNPKIALFDTAIEFKKTEVDAKYQLNDPSQLQSFMHEEEKILNKMVDKIVESGANVIMTTKGIDDLAQYKLGKKGIMGLRRIRADDMTLLAKATGATVVTEIPDLDESALGNAGCIEEKKIGENYAIFITACKDPKAVTILIRGGTEHVVDEIERALIDALSAVSLTLVEGKFTVGGGASAMEISKALVEYSSKVGGREEMAIRAFGEAIEIVPWTLAENAGLDALNVIIELRKAHTRGEVNRGLNAVDGTIEDMYENDVIEPLKVGIQAIMSAMETATMVLRIDDIIASVGTPPQQTGPAPPQY